MENEILAAYIVAIHTDGEIKVVLDTGIGQRQAVLSEVQMTSRYVYDQLRSNPPAPKTPQDRMRERLEEHLHETQPGNPS